MSITKALAKRVANYDNRHSTGSTLRARRIAPLLAMIDSAFARNGRVDLIDIGGTVTYWNIVPQRYVEARRLTITIVNLPEHPYPDDHGPFRFVQADGCDLARFQDRSFHVAHSNSVIEHVGDWARMTQFAKELRRVAEEYFVQTPNYWFPVEPHCMTPFFHWLPKPARLWLVSRLALGHWHRARSVDEAVRLIESARLLNSAMFRELFPDARLITERYWGMAKSFVAVKGACTEFDEKILSRYARGMKVGEIQNHPEEIYGAEAPHALLYWPSG